MKRNLISLRSKNNRTRNRYERRSIGVLAFLFRRFGGLASLIVGAGTFYSVFLYGFLDNLGRFSVFVDSQFIFSEVLQLTILIAVFSFTFRIYSMSKFHSDSISGEKRYLKEIFKKFDDVMLVSMIFGVLYFFYLDFLTSFLFVAYVFLNALMFHSMALGLEFLSVKLLLRSLFSIADNPFQEMKANPTLIKAMLVFTLSISFSLGNLRFVALERATDVEIQLANGSKLSASFVGKSGVGVFLIADDRPKWSLLVPRDRNVLFVPFAAIERIGN